MFFQMTAHYTFLYKTVSKFNLVSYFHSRLRQNLRFFFFFFFKTTIHALISNKFLFIQLIFAFHMKRVLVNASALTFQDVTSFFSHHDLKQYDTLL